MDLRFQFRRYRQPFRLPVRTAHGPWTDREGVIVRLQELSEGNSPAVGFGEAAPIPWFGTETVDEVEAGCRALGEWIEEAALDHVPEKLGCLQHALASAVAEVRRRRAGATDEGGGPRDEGRGRGSRGTGERVEGEGRGIKTREHDVGIDQNLGSTLNPRPSTLSAAPRSLPPTLGVAALLPAGRAALVQIAPKAEVGFRVFKWKVGVGELSDELALLDDVCAQLPSGGKLRLDANGAWDRRQAERWLERCADRPVEFVEQPCFVDPSAGKSLQRRTDDILLGLAGDYPTPIALDESLGGEHDLERWVGAGWPGIFVVKPSLIADIARALQRLQAANADVVFSSALETAVGAKSALEAAFAWKHAMDNAATAKEEPGNTKGAGGVARNTAKSDAPYRTRALGFGVWPLFADSRFDGPGGAPFVRVQDVEAINPEAVWNALS